MAGIFLYYPMRLVQKVGGFAHRKTMLYDTI